MSFKTILVVDDDEDIRDSLTQVLEFGGYKTLRAINGLDALETLKNVSADSMPALIILDLMMPEMDGAQFLDYIHKHYPETFGKIPVIVATAKGSISTDSTLLLAAERLKKPFDLENLYAMVAKYIAN